MKGQIPLTATLLLAVSLVTINAEQASQSLKGKSDEELLRIVVKGRNDTQKQQTSDSPFSIDSSLLDRLWEMAPREAALALANEYVCKDVKGRVKFEIEEAPNEKPPTAGEIGIRWISGNYYAMPERGATVLHYEGSHSRLSISDFQILGRVSEKELEDALNRTDEYDVPLPVAQQAYEILWWLSHIRRVGDRLGGSGFSSTDDLADGFWMSPDGPFFGRVLLGVPDAENLNDDEFSSFPAFAYALIRQIIDKQTIKPKFPLPTIGRFLDVNEDAAFLRVHSNPENDQPGVIKRWVDRMISILRNPERHKMYADVLYDLVPAAEPLKYKDPDIDRALLDLFHDADAAAAAHEQKANDAHTQQKKILEETEQGKRDVDDSKWRTLSKQAVEEESAGSSIRGVAEIAAEMLGYRDNIDVFPDLMKRARTLSPSTCDFYGSNSLIGAAALAGKHPNLRPQLSSYLRSQLADIRKSQLGARQLFECVWRGNLHELSPDIEKVATHSPDESEDGAMFTSPAPANGNGRFHAARAILMAWRETDRLTKIKLNALIHSNIAGDGPVPDFMHHEFDALPATEKLTFQNFITWLRKVDSSNESLDEVFTPHTPRPKEEDLGLRRFWYE